MEKIHYTSLFYFIKTSCWFLDFNFESPAIFPDPGLQYRIKVNNDIIKKLYCYKKSFIFFFSTKFWIKWVELVQVMIQQPLQQLLNWNFKSRSQNLENSIQITGDSPKPFSGQISNDRNTAPNFCLVAVTCNNYLWTPTKKPRTSMNLLLY